ncbi:TetR/AcrR family transcriptional regulator, partial [Falsihalocynthiibacter sp. BN13B15]
MKKEGDLSEDTTCCGKTRRGRPPQMQRPAREAAILRVTTQLLLEIPFDDVTMAVIATKAGMSKRTVYEHFKNREDLLVSAIIDVSRTIFLPLSSEDAQRPLLERLSLLLQINTPSGFEANK